MKQQDNPLWVEKYRPQTVSDIILPDTIKKTFQEFVNQKNIPSLLLTGNAGMGKTTAAKAMLEELGCDYITINGSLNGGIDTLRHDISKFASSISFQGARKYVILDEADYLSYAVQPALRNFMEEFSKNCGFILTCNYKNKILDAIQSRCSVVEFKIPKKDSASMATQFFKRVCDILTNENVEYDKSAVATLLKQHFPDFRRVLNELQRYSAAGKIDSGILIDMSTEKFVDVVKMIKDQNFTAMRKWVADNMDMESHAIFRKFYDTASELITKESIPHLVMLIAEYQYKAGIVIDQEINIVAFFTMVMAEGEIQFL